VAKNGSEDFLRRRKKSTKTNKIMRNEPNLGQSQIFITAVSTTSCSEKMKLDTWSKRTQTKPIFLGWPEVMQNDFRIFRAQTILIYGKIGNFVTF
jgi:hypothetical protein